MRPHSRFLRTDRARQRLIPTTALSTGTYSIAEGALDFLAKDEQVTAVFTVTLTDSKGGTVTQDVTVTITGSNDAPVINAISPTALTEQTNTAALTASIPVSFTDVDLTDIGHTASITGVQASGTTTGLALTSAQLIELVTPGTVTKASGSSSGSINMGFSAPATAIDYLAAGEVLTLTYTVAVNDGDGGITPQTFVVTITGTNDAPTITTVEGTTDVAGAVTEDASLSTLTDTGTITFDDVDLTNTHTVSVASASGNTLGGTLTLGGVSESAITSEGSVPWTYSVANSATQYLAAGQTASEVFTVTVSDGNGGYGHPGCHGHHHRHQRCSGG